MKGEMGKNGVPAAFIKPPGDPEVSKITCAHESVQQKNRWSRGPPTAQLQAHSGSVVFGKPARYRCVPLDPPSVLTLPGWRRHSIELLARENRARREIRFKFFLGADLIPMAPLQQIHRAAHGAIHGVGQRFFKRAPHVCCKMEPLIGFSA
jgi:hypothetical protein